MTNDGPYRVVTLAYPSPDMSCTIPVLSVEGPGVWGVVSKNMSHDMAATIAGLMNIAHRNGVKDSQAAVRAALGIPSP